MDLDAPSDLDSPLDLDGGSGSGLAYPDEVIADGPLLYWRLGESSGTTATDDSGNGNDGTYSNGTVLGTTGLITGDSDTAATFSPSSGSYLTGSSTYGPTIPTFSFEVIVNVPTGMNSSLPLITFSDGAGLYTTGTSNIRMAWSTDNVGSIDAIYSTTMSADTPVHVVGVYDGVNAIIYLDGVVDNSEARPTGIEFIGDALEPLIVGTPGWFSPFAATLDEVAFYDHALSPTDVADHFAAISGGGYDAAVLANTPNTYWRLGESSGTTAVDASGFGDVGTYHGNPVLGATGFLSGDPDTAVTFQGTVSAVTSNTTFGPTTYPAFSIEAIVTPTDVTNFPTIAGFYSNINSDYIDLTLFDNGSGAYVDFSADSAAGFWEVASTPGSITMGQPFHLVGTWDGTNIVVYINGVEAASDTSSEVIELVAAENFTAGNDTGGNAYNGVLDEVAFYDTALSAGRVAAHYAAMMAALSIVAARTLQSSVTTHASLAAALTQATVSGAGIIMSIANSVDAPYIELTWSESNNQHLGINVLTSGGVTHYDTSLVIDDASWHSFAVALDADAGIGTLYVDGRTGVAFPIDSSTWPAAGGKWNLGRKTSGTQYFQGRLDEFKVSGVAFDETIAYQASTVGLYGTTLSVTGAGGVSVMRPTASVTTVASLIAQLRTSFIHLVASLLSSERASATFAAIGSLRVDVPTAPVSAPETWVATTVVDAATNDQTLFVTPQTVAIPTGAILYFANGVTVQLVAPANVRDHIIYIAPLVGIIAANKTGTGINPATYTVTTSGATSVSATTILINPNPQYMAAGSSLYFTSSPSTAVILTADAPFGATSVSVSSLANAIPAVTRASGLPIPPGSGNPHPPGPGSGSAPPPLPAPSPLANIKRVSLRYPEATLDGSGFPV